MRRGLLVLLALVALVSVTALVTCWLRKPATPTDYLCQVYGLDAGRAQRVTQLQADYEKHCAEMCARIEASDRRLAKIVRSNAAVTPEICAALAEADAVRTDCRVNMLSYVYAVAAELPANKRQAYLDAVLPTILNPEQMHGRHARP